MNTHVIDMYEWIYCFKNMQLEGSVMCVCVCVY